MRASYALLPLVLARTIVAALSICATDNTSPISPTYYQFQSNGYCQTLCQSSGYAYAVLQGYNCWCSNETPSLNTDMSNCDDSCPGFPSDKCAATGYYGYILVNADLVVTPASSTTSTTPTPTSKSTPTSTTPTPTVPTSTSPTTPSTTSIPATTSATEDTETTEEATSSVATPSVASSTSGVLSALATTSASSTPVLTSSLQPVTSIVYSVKTVTNSATVEYFTTQIATTTTPGATDTSSNNNGINGTNPSKKSNKGFFQSKGKVAGVFTAVGIVIAAILAALLWFLCRKRSDDEDIESSEDYEKKTFDPIQSGALARAGTISASMNRSMAGHGHHHSIGGETMYGPFYSRRASINTNSPQRVDSQVTRSSGNMPKIDDDEYLEIDQRLDPQSAMFINADNSNISLYDEYDYSRKLGVVNPDVSSSLRAVDPEAGMSSVEEEDESALIEEVHHKRDGSDKSGYSYDQ
ncbi:hypothetical protein BABINDRAFT_162021 [Babjeviella inositovora NRRL Y-12698]|uniref:WSC domain-containing protein n=1 Tax=Babjeviella inositovora NRRL Y-12698 TaxID=984486 RepID=A0A1E3QPM8_9ASCO|nr:uncharacterized protein BABINDRAFT_162021 [Babjeviella inositovora NRRL Y-12698]ODQ79645.1 hypothetical protein BABINDRAFT_162021 [Babjeviella inositovora NRRL Y-12698]